MTLNLDRRSWQKVKFGDVVCQVKASTDPVADGVERYVAGEHMDSDSLAISRWGMVGDGYLGPAFHRKFESGQVLYGSRRTYLRKVALAEFDGVCANTTFVMETADSSRLLPELLPFVMSTEAFHAHSIAESKGSVNPYVNWPDIAKYEFELPPLDQQRRIADLLWAVEYETRSIAVRAGALEALENALLRALWSQGFDLARLDSMVASSLGGVWGVEPGLADSDVYVIRGTDIGLGGDIDFSRAPCRGVTTSELAKRRLEPGDVLLEKSGGSPDQPVGKCAVVGELPGPAVASNFVIVLRPREDVTSGAYLAAVLQAMRATGRMAPYVGKTTGISNLRTKDLLSAQVPCPRLPEQGDFLLRVQRIKATRARLGEESSQLMLLRENLISEVFG